MSYHTALLGREWGRLVFSTVFHGIVILQGVNGSCWKKEGKGPLKDRKIIHISAELRKKDWPLQAVDHNLKYEWSSLSAILWQRDLQIKGRAGAVAGGGARGPAAAGSGGPGSEQVAQGQPMWLGGTASVRRGFKMTNEEPLPKKVRLSETDSKVWHEMN